MNCVRNFQQVLHAQQRDNQFRPTVKRCLTVGQNTVLRFLYIVFSFQNNNIEPKKRKIGNCPEETMREAVNLVIAGGSLKKVAVLKDISYQTLGRYAKKLNRVKTVNIIRLFPCGRQKASFTFEIDLSSINIR